MEPLLAWKGRRVRSALDGPESAHKKVPQSIRHGSLFFIPSPLEGWGLDTLLERLPPESCVVLYETDSGLWEHCLPELQLRIKDDSRIHFLLQDTEQAVVALFTTLSLPFLRRCEFLSFNGVWLWNADRVRTVFSRLEDGVTQWWANRATALKLGPLWIKNLFSNLTSQRVIDRPWPSWGSRTIVVAGAGVSLEGHLSWLQNHRKEIHILAVDTALGSLRDGGIVPDAVVAVEAQWANLADFAGLLSPPMTLFADLTSLPAVTRIWKQPPFWFISRFAEVNLWNRLPWKNIPLIPALGSVGVLAVWIAWTLTAGQVLLTGLDFSYPLGKTHASGSPSLRSLLSQSTRLTPVEQRGSWRHGTTINTPKKSWISTRILQRYALLLNEQVEQHQLRTATLGSSVFLTSARVWPTDQAPPNEKIPPGPLLQGGAEGVTRWMDQERQKWIHLRELFESLNTIGLTDRLEAEFRDVLVTLDYLTFDFPDPMIRLESDWLSRVKVRLLTLLERWG